MWTDERIKAEVVARGWTDSVAGAAGVDVVLADDAIELLSRLRDECAAHVVLGQRRAQAVVQGLERALLDAYIAECDQRYELEQKIAELTAEMERSRSQPDA